MAIIFSNGVTEVAIEHSVSGRSAWNVLHVKIDEAEIGPDPEDSARDVLNNWQDHVVPLMTSNVTLLGCAYRSLDSSNSTTGYLLPDDEKPFVGEQPATASPPNVAWLIHKEVTGRARSERNGRMFIAGVEEAGVSAAGVVTGDYPALWSAALDDFLSGVSGGLFDDQKLVVLTIPKAARVKGDTVFTVGTNEVARLTLDPMVATMRKRLR